MNDNYFFISNKTNLDDIDNLHYNNTYNIHDSLNKQLIFAPLAFDNKNFFIETDYLKIIGIDKNKIIAKMNLNMINVFDKLDNKLVDLIGNICENYTNILNENIQYIAINDENILKVGVTNDTNVIINNTKSTLSEMVKLINLSNDTTEIYMRSVIRISSINIYPNEDLCHGRIYLSLLDIKNVNVKDFNNNIVIKNYTFTSNENDIYQNLVYNDSDLNITSINNNENLKKESIKNISKNTINDNNNDNDNDNDNEYNNDNDNDNNNNSNNDNESNNDNDNNSNNDSNNNSNNSCCLSDSEIMNDSDSNSDDDNDSDSDDDNDNNSNDNNSDDDTSSNICIESEKIKIPTPQPSIKNNKINNNKTNNNKTNNNKTSDNKTSNKNITINTNISQNIKPKRKYNKKK